MPRLCIEHTRLRKKKNNKTNKQLYKYMWYIYIHCIYIRIHTSIYSIHNIQTYTESIKNQSLVVPSLTTQLQQHEQGEHHCCEAHRVDEVCTKTRHRLWRKSGGSHNRFHGIQCAYTLAGFGSHWANMLTCMIDISFMMKKRNIYRVVICINDLTGRTNLYFSSLPPY